MPEENEEFSSGREPGRIKPTVIGGGEVKAVKPTVIAVKETAQPSQSSATPKPTIIGGEAKGVAKSPQGQPKPTVIGGGANPTPITTSTTKESEVTRLKTTVIGPPPEMPDKVKTVAVSSQSVMPGVVRKGLEVSTVDLERLFPGYSRMTINLVAEILKSTIVDTLSMVSCSQWGGNVQAKYQKLVNESLKLTSAQAVQDGARHNVRLYELLQELVEAFRNEGSSGLIFRKKINPEEKLREIREELDQLRDHLGRILPELRVTQERLEEIGSDSGKLAEELQAWSLGANYLADHIGPNDSRSVHLMDQGISLTKMIAHVQEGIMLRNVTIQEVDALADRIQESVLVTLPAWLEKTSFTFRKTKVTDTEHYELRQGLEQIVNQLK